MKSCFFCQARTKPSWHFCPACGKKITKGGWNACPVCKRLFAPQGLKNHIVHVARTEYFAKPGIPNSKTTPHFVYYAKHIKGK